MGNTTATNLTTDDEEVLRVTRRQGMVGLTDYQIRALALECDTWDELLDKVNIKTPISIRADEDVYTLDDLAEYL